MKWLIWSNEHDAWWGPNECGYTAVKSRAGLYDLETAARIVTRANEHLSERDRPKETMIPVDG